MVPCTIASRIHGMTSSSISSSDVVASNPSISRAFSTEGTRRWTSCSNGSSCTSRSGSSRPLIFRQIASAELEHSGRVGRREVEVLVQRRGVLHRRRNPLRKVSAIRVVTHLVTGAQDVQRILALERPSG